MGLLRKYHCYTHISELGNVTSKLIVKRRVIAYSISAIRYCYHCNTFRSDTRIRRSVKANSVKVAYIDFKLVICTNNITIIVLFYIVMPLNVYTVIYGTPNGKANAQSHAPLNNTMYLALYN